MRIPATVSVGVAELMLGETVSSWLEGANRVLYLAKDRGRDQLCLAIEASGAIEEF